jgi:hypothetical protein
MWFPHKKTKPDEKYSSRYKKCVVEKWPLVMSFEIWIETIILFVKVFFGSEEACFFDGDPLDENRENYSEVEESVA